MVKISRLLSFELLIVLAFAFAARAQVRPEPFVEFIRDDRRRTETIEIDATERAAFTVPPTLFGTFTENIWDAVYGGVWAQVLHNPSFEPDYLSAQNTIDAARYGRLVTDPSFGSGYVRVEPLADEAGAQRNRFLSSSALGLPLPWEPLRPTGARYEVRDGDAANSYRSLLIMGLEGKEVGIRQGVYLPVHRTLKYNGSLWAKTSVTENFAPDLRINNRMSRLLTVSLRRRDHPDEIIARADVERRLPLPQSGGATNDWVPYEFALDVPPGKVASLEKVDLCISVDDERRVLIDNVLLFPADHIEGFDPEIIRAARDLRTPLLRFGGNFASGYHWLDGVGDRERRRTILNQAWGLPEYNHFGTDEFVALCRLINAEPQICVNAGSGTPEEAAAWVEYCNGDGTTKYGAMRIRNGHREPYGVKLWEIGNELWGDFQIGWQTPKSNARRYLEFTQAMRRVDPSIRFIATGADIDFYSEWNGELIRQAGANLDLISTHLVIGMQPGEQRRTDADDAFTHRADFAVPVGVGRKLDEMHAQLQADARTRGRAKFAFTEWQFWSPRAEDPRFTNLGGAINSAAFFNMLVRRADFVPISNMSNLVHFAGIHRQRGRTFVTPSYHVLKLYSDMAGARPVRLRMRGAAYDVRAGNRRVPDVPDVPYIDALALLSSDNQILRLYLVNRDLTEPISVDLTMRGFTAKPDAATLRRLAADSFAAANTPENPTAVTVIESKLVRKITDDEVTHSSPNVAPSQTFSLPAHSVTVVEFQSAAAHR